MTDIHLSRKINVMRDLYSTYSKLAKSGKDQHGRVFLSVKNGQLCPTTHKSDRASNTRISKCIIKTIHDISAEASQGVKEKKIEEFVTGIDHFIDFFSKYIEKNARFDDMGFHEKIQASTIPIPVDNPFYNTDMLVFKTSYKGALPLNGIREGDFLQMSNVIRTLRESKKMGALSIGSPDPPLPEMQKSQQKQENKLIDLLVQLCERKTGRELINSLIQQDKGLRLIPCDEIDACAVTHLRLGTSEVSRVDIYLNPELIVSAEVTLNGRTYSEDCPLFIVLGHEMIHVLHNFSDQHATKTRRDTAHPKSDNLEELLTMTGYEVPPLADGYQTLFQLWDPLSENGLRSVYGLPPRTEKHAGSLTTQSIQVNPIKDAFFDRIKKDPKLDLSTVFTEKFKETVQIKYKWNDFLDKAAKHACKHSRWEIVTALITEGANSREVKKQFKSAVEAGRTFATVENNGKLIDDLSQILETSLNANLSPDTISNEAKQAIFHEVSRQNYLGDIRERLTPKLKQAVEVTTNWNEFLTSAALHACEHENWQLAAQLMSAGASKEAIQQQWQSTLDSRLISFGKKENWKQMLALAQLGADVFQPIGDAKNLMEFACKHSHPAIHDLLHHLVKECQVDPNSSDQRGNKLVEVAVMNDRFENVKDLVELGADPKLKDRRFTLLHLALDRLHPPDNDKLLKYLIQECGIDPNTSGSNGAALWIAVKRRHFDLIPSLIEWGANPGVVTGFNRFNILHALATKEDVSPAVLEYLVLQCDMDPEAANEKGITPLSLATGKNPERLRDLAERRKQTPKSEVI